MAAGREGGTCQSGGAPGWGTVLRKGGQIALAWGIWELRPHFLPKRDQSDQKISISVFSAPDPREFGHCHPEALLCCKGKQYF